MTQGTRITKADWHRNVCMNSNGDMCHIFGSVKAKARICNACDNERHAQDLAENTTVPICKDCQKAALKAS